MRENRGGGAQPKRGDPLGRQTHAIDRLSLLALSSLTPGEGPSSRRNEWRGVGTIALGGVSPSLNPTQSAEKKKYSMTFRLDQIQAES